MTKLAIRLFHGRKSADEQLDDWGFNGPIIGPFDSVQWTYGALRLIKDGEQIGELVQIEDMIFYGDSYYGDFCIAPVELLKAEGNKIEPFHEFHNYTDESYVKDVTQILENKYGLTLNDIGGEEEVLKVGKGNNDLPEEFVAYIARKYDLNSK